MPIKVYSNPEGITPPTWNSSEQWEEHAKKEDQYVKDVKTFCEINSKHNLAGKEVKFPVADGYARYVVFTPTKLIHLEVGDAWHYEHIERLLAKDIVEKVKSQEAMRKLFSK